jgi:LmbE family N-acetylglucosaminyl deacetylase
MKRLLPYVYRNFLPARLRNVIDLFPSLRGTVSVPEVIDKPDGAKVLVLAPHPDDEILGAGGTLHKHHLAGDRIVTVYMTDGRKGGDGLVAEGDLVTIRREEARRAAAVIGIDALIFLDNRDGELCANRKTIAELVEVIKEHNPDLIYLPFLWDAHPDHLATNAVFASAVPRLQRRHFTCYSYEVWSPIMPNCLVRITDVAEVKKAALAHFDSQIKCFALIEAVLGLAQYRGIMHGRGEPYAEAFLRCSAEEYIRLWKVARS